MKKHSVKALCFLMSLILICSMGFSASAAGTQAVTDVVGSKSYTITSPYETVDWDTWGTCKTNLHTHSTASDGEVDYADMIEAYYAQGFDVLAMTDHGVVNSGWNAPPKTVPILSFNAILKKPKYLTQARYEEITTGADRDGRGMTDVPKGIELNAAVLTKNHVNGYFVDYGQGLWGNENDYETPIAAVDALGGITVINHPGDWLGSSGDITIATDPRNVKFFADIIKKYPSCLGIEIFNLTNNTTKHDRVLWDELLQSVIPTGRNVWGFSNSDAHELDDIDTSFEVFMMPENNVANVRTAMENGTFFAISRYPKYELPGDFQPSGMYPVVTSIEVDDEKDQITVQGTDYNTIQWIADGVVIAEGSTIDLNSYEDQISCYVRAQLIGDGGVCLTQAFIADDGNMVAVEEEENPILEFFYNIWFKISSTRIYVIFQELFREVF